jgi:hypothetical protein
MHRVASNRMMVELSTAMRCPPVIAACTPGNCFSTSATTRIISFTNAVLAFESDDANFGSAIINTCRPSPLVMRPSTICASPKPVCNGSALATTNALMPTGSAATTSLSTMPSGPASLRRMVVR